MSIKSKVKTSKIENFEEFNKKKKQKSYSLAANAIANLLVDKKTESNVLGFTTSFENFTKKNQICLEICSKITEFSKKIFLINLEKEAIFSKNFETLNLYDINIQELADLIETKKTDYDIVIVNLPCANGSVMAINQTRTIKNVVLLEKYNYSKYESFENVVSALSQNSVKVLGIIASF